MGLLTYSKSTVFPKIVAGEGVRLLERLQHVLATKRSAALVLEGNTLHFRDLFLKRLDLLPIPIGSIAVSAEQGKLAVTYAADYRWAKNRRGRLLVYIAILISVAVTFYKSLQTQFLGGVMPSPWFLLAIPIYLAILWFFVFGLNSWYSRVYLARLVESLAKLKPLDTHPQA